MASLASASSMTDHGAGLHACAACGYAANAKQETIKKTETGIIFRTDLLPLFARRPRAALRIRVTDGDGCRSPLVVPRSPDNARPWTPGGRRRSAARPHQG